MLPIRLGCLLSISQTMKSHRAGHRVLSCMMNSILSLTDCVPHFSTYCFEKLLQCNADFAKSLKATTAKTTHLQADCH